MIILDKYFLSGGVIPKASGFLGHGLVNQAYGNTLRYSTSDPNYSIGGDVQQYQADVEKLITELESDKTIYAAPNFLNEVDRAYAIFYSSSMKVKSFILGILTLAAFLL